jgi:O-succinylbenzoic acid--CoA ligase
MYHISGLAIVWRWLSVGARLKMASGDLLADLAHVSHASLVATQLLRVMEPLLAARSKSAEQQASAVSLRCVLLGGSHIPVQLAQQVDALGIETWVGYGMTEAASTVSAKRISSTAAQTSNSVGRVLPKRSLALQGERILIAGDTLASGYYHQGALKPLMVAEPVTQCSTKRIEGAWFDTNDLGRWQGGELTILGRADNRFISGGENIYCEEIEAVLQRHDTVSQVIVVPVKSAEFGARPVAVIASSSGLQVASYQALLATCLEKYKWPIDYFLLADTDSVSNGVKISRAKVKDWLVSVQDKYRIYSP